MLESDYSEPVNIGNPSEISMAEEIISLTGTEQKVIYKDLPVDDPKQRKPDITKAKEMLNWFPKIDRSEGLNLTDEYFKGLTKEELFHTE